jgi:hypothetical protein
MKTPVDLEEHLIQMPRVTGSSRPAAQAVGISLPELETPFSDGLIGEGDTAAGHHLFDIAEAQGEAKI